MLIGGDDISNDVITFGTCFPMFFYIRARFRFGLIVGNLTAQSTRSTGKLEVEFKFQRLSWKLSFLFPPRRQSARENLLAGYTYICSRIGNVKCIRSGFRAGSKAIRYTFSVNVRVT